MTDIVEFLEARLAEDEALAHATTEYQPIDEWDAVGVEDAENPEIARKCWTVVEIAMPRRSNQAARSLMTHIAHHDPARVLREVKAKRSILAEHTDDEGQCARCLDSDGITYLGAYTAPWPCPTLRALAAVYSDHPDYRPDW